MVGLPERTIWHTLGEKLRPEHTALVVLDVQNDHCSPGGAAERRGLDVRPAQGIVPPLRGLLEGARKTGCLVIFVQGTRHPLGLSDSAVRMSYMNSLYRERGGHTQTVVEGTWGWQLVDGLDPRPNEVIVRKHRTSAFVGTGLDVYLRANERKTLVMAGVATDGAVLATALDGSYYDYYVVVAEDCVASADAKLHEAALTILRARFDVVPATTIAGHWPS